MIEFCVDKNSHLGDCIFVLNLLHNNILIGKFSKNVIVNGPTMVEFLIEIFDYCFVYGCNNSNGRLLVIKDLILPWIPNFSWTTYGFSFKERLKIPETKVCNLQEDKKSIVAFQFDSRSYNDTFKKRLDKTECEYFLKKYSFLEKKVGIGGLDTIPYLNYEFKLGNLIEITCFLKKCKKFIGVDSGISHMAGMLKLNGNIIIQDSRELIVDRIKTFYNFMYPTLICRKRKIKTIFPINL